ncbi:hypothetical protein [Hydrocarboniclastica marina]|uniref:Uncharacterized protein n=1 Tax=Hydrocarboniclastica marina TaxID=2259620 RepID=A0A4P7XHJ4_9ALTE|nr:hypothetical protein [Hydrocarboniclastica marina]QCF25924.1 hypothetical protein soil367_08335 [Hydrocarboniclastica marina]
MEGKAGPTGIVIGIFALVLLLGAFTELANWYVRSELIAYAIPALVVSALLSGLIHKWFKKLGGVLGVLTGVLFVLHFLLAISAH